MFTTGEDKPLEAIMSSIFDKEKGGAAIDNKVDDKEMAAYFETILPEYDKERVYVSNMRKLITWYNTLQITGSLKEKEENKTGDDKSVALKPDEKAKIKKTVTKTSSKTKTSVGVKKTTGVRKTGTA